MNNRVSLMYGEHRMNDEIEMLVKNLLGDAAWDTFVEHGRIEIVPHYWLVFDKVHVISVGVGVVGKDD